MGSWWHIRRRLLISCRWMRGCKRMMWKSSNKGLFFGKKGVERFSLGRGNALFMDFSQIIDKNRRECSTSSSIDKLKKVWYNNKAVARGKAALRNSKECANRKRRAEEHRCREQGAAKRKEKRLNGSFRREGAKKRLYAFRWDVEQRIDWKEQKEISVHNLFTWQNRRDVI